ncbi:uncharacterized protein LOC129241665 isoform X4 [Anastrepha obliqua]|uniref:uncharacterized protein LOC129241665 isoform X4 n=1 Tax=Anastrepha obliqua TaxID=95512 RepID=UPI002409739D|nr:uncharacterized protein LOC129241665 isoform X4 [Anastrepha obliqua]
MLLLKSVRKAPTLVSTTTARISGPSLVASLEQHRNLILTNKVLSNGLTGAPTAVRFYADDAKREQQSSRSTPNAPALSLPDRKQVERFFFRVLALIWDISVWTYFNTKKAIDTHIVANDSVQWYWRRLHERMEQAKKEW